MSLDALVDEVRRRRTPDQELHLTAIAVLADPSVAMDIEDRMALALAGWEAVRAEGATEVYPTVSVPSLSLIRSGVGLTDPIFARLPKDDRANLVCIGFLSIIGERLGDGTGRRRRRRRPRQNHD
jgi:hypothetical protein